MKPKNGAGFTLIEMLVVVAIIGLLASVIVVYLGISRAKARDAKRRADLRQMATALALYFDANGSYPSTGSNWWGTCSDYGSHGTSGPTGWIPNLAPTYVAALPVDPKPVGNNGCYMYYGNGADYKVLTYLTVESPIPTNDPMYSGYVNTYTIYSPGGKNW